MRREKKVIQQQKCEKKTNDAAQVEWKATTTAIE